MFQPETAAQVISPDFYEIFEGHGSVMLIIDQQTADITNANQAAVDFCGYTEAKLESMKISDINTLDPDAISREMEAAAAEERNYFIFNHRLASGEIRIVEVYSYPLTLLGRPILYSIIYDITEEVALAEQSRENNAIFVTAISLFMIIMTVASFLLYNKNRALKDRDKETNNYLELHKTFIDADRDLIYLKDEHLKYVLVNTTFADLYERKTDQLIGLDDFDLSGNTDFAAQQRNTDLEVLETKIHSVSEVEFNNNIYRTTKFPVAMLNGSYGVGTVMREISGDLRNRDIMASNLLRNSILVDVLTKSFNTTEAQFSYALNECLKLSESVHGFIALTNQDSGQIEIKIWSEPVAAECVVSASEQIRNFSYWNILGKAADKKKPVIVNNIVAPDSLDLTSSHGHAQPTNFIAIPIIIDNIVVAILGMFKLQDAFDKNTVYQATTLMSGVWHATERREAQTRLFVERNKYLQTLTSIGDGVIVVDREGLINMLNPVAEQLTGWQAGEAIGRHYKDILVLSHEKKGAEMEDPIEKAMETGTSHKLGDHAILTSKDGTIFFVEDNAAPIKDIQGATTGAVMVFRDVTVGKIQREKIEYLSYHDSLTGLYNRRFFEEELNRLDTERNIPVSIIIGDVNNLKLVNDVFGHTYGDQLLQKVAQEMASACRTDDIIARWGGDEFVILLPNTSGAEAKDICERIHLRLNDQRIAEIEVSVAIGFDTKKKANIGIRQILEHAEDNMYSEKINYLKKQKLNLADDLIGRLHKKSVREKAHSERVSEFAQALGREIGLTDDQLSKLKDLGYLHDIGKITLDSNLLNKIGALSESETVETEQHVVSGYQLLIALSNTTGIAEYLFAHHERWDGTGYPKGLKGGDIPLLSRIIAVVSCYEMMTNDLSNKKPLTKEEAAEELKQGAGSQFDPDLIAAFLKVIAAL